MEIRIPKTRYTSQIRSDVPIFAPCFLISRRNKRSHFAYRISVSKFSGYPSVSTQLCCARGRSPQVFAHFAGRPDRRRNSLRKKLIDDPQVRRNLISPDNSSNFQFPDRESRSFGEYFDNVGGKDSYSHLSAGGGGADHKLEDGAVEEWPLKYLGESALRNKLESWVEQYKKDLEFWGLGSAPVFTIFGDPSGKVKRVSVNEDEILRRSQVEGRDVEYPTEVNSKISYAKRLAREMESGKNAIPTTSSVAKFVDQGEEYEHSKPVLGFLVQPPLLRKLSGVGGVLLFGFIIVMAFKKFFSLRNKEVRYTKLEKEMLRRKIKSRKEREVLEKGSVEVVHLGPDPPMISIEKPKLDGEAVMASIAKLKASTAKLTLHESSGNFISKFEDCDNSIQESKDMAPDIKSTETSSVESDRKEFQTENDMLNKGEPVGERREEAGYIMLNNSKGDSGRANILTGVVGTTLPNNIASLENDILHISTASPAEVPDVGNRTTDNLNERENALKIAEASSSDTRSESSETSKGSTQRKLRVITSVNEAREYLSEKHDQSRIKGSKTVEDSSGTTGLSSVGDAVNNTRSRVNLADAFEPTISVGPSEFLPVTDSCGDSFPGDDESIVNKSNNSEDFVERCGVNGAETPISSFNEECSDSGTEMKPQVKTENWIKENFGEVEPVLKKIGGGFKDNFAMAREKRNQQSEKNFTLTQLLPNDDNDELEWMKDDSLREIVFQVRENELTGRDPFHSMDAKDRLAFFKGLEEKVDRENEKLLKLHEWLHSNIENLDYGADGISLYDPPEKVIPRWKGSPIERSPEFLSDFLEQRKAIFGGKDELENTLNKNEQNSVGKVKESNEKISTSLQTSDREMLNHDQQAINSKTIIEGSDGSVRAGKKSGMEFWQHTKKWSRGFLESYNAETDPEVKSTMKDIGKDLDRWITEKEIKEAAEYMENLPQRNRKFMDKKLNKLKREMELFGPQAVASKYREYADEEEEDYLWWLDLPHVICIELYTVHNGEQRIGFYSLEMATDLDLEPKPHHVIAFQDAADCKNLCYIIQAHLDMLGSGNAFVVPLPPKDAYQEAKANGFGVTVIRKGELQLNVDEPLEGVEEQITEIGSKMYHDKIMRERSVDISTLMKGVCGADKRPTKRKSSKRLLKKPRKK